MNRKYQLIGKKLIYFNLRQFYDKIQGWRLILHTTTLDTNLTFLFLGHFLVGIIVVSGY